MRPLNPMMSQFLIERCLQDFFAGNHNAEIDNLVVITGEHDADNILSDVVDVPLTVAMTMRPCDRLAGLAARSFSMNGVSQATERFMTRALDDLRQEHSLPAPKRSPTTFIPSIKRAFDHVQGSSVLKKSLLGIAVDVVHDALDRERA